MKKLIIMVVFLAFMGCAAGSNQLQDMTDKMSPYVDTLATDWPKASGLIRGAVGIENLPQSIVSDMDKIDLWFKDKDGNWIDGEVKLNTYQRWYIAGVRSSHTGPVLHALIQQYAPGIIGMPQVMGILSFLGLAQ